MRALPKCPDMSTRCLASLSVAVLLSAAGCAPDEEELRHGYVKLEFLRGDSVDSNPYVGTTQIIATMQYLECLSGYYAENMNERADGPDGAAVFGTREEGGEGWRDRLCEVDLPMPIDCEVVSISQQLDVGTADTLSVVYNVMGDIEGRQLAIGPFPNPETAACMAGELPEVRVSQAGMKGKAGDTDLWRTETFTPTEAVVGQGAPIRIYAAPFGS